MDNIKTTGHKPPAVMTKYICQFYLAKGNGYKSFTIDTKHNKNDYDSINFLFDEPLEIHHLMPLGANKDVNSLIKNARINITNIKYMNESNKAKKTHIWPIAVIFIVTFIVLDATLSLLSVIMLLLSS